MNSYRDRYNSVVFETIAANSVDFLVVDPTFFTTKGNWTRYDDTITLYRPPRTPVTSLQDTVLNDKYLDRAVFDNITGTECVSRYTAAFITSGTVFGVPTLEVRQQAGINASHSFQDQVAGSGNLNIVEKFKYECKLQSTTVFRSCIM
jgi:hypothetical protein